MLGERKHTPPCPSAGTFLRRKNWGPQRKDFGGRYGFPGFVGVFVSTTGLESFFFRLWGEKCSPNDFLSGGSVRFFRLCLCTYFGMKKKHRNEKFAWTRSGPVLRDTARLSRRYPLLRAMGFFGVSTWPIGRDTPSPFSEWFPLGEHAKWRCDTPPQKGYLSDTCAIPYENKGNGCDTPLCDTISKGYCAIWGGISHWATKPELRGWWGFS